MTQLQKLKAQLREFDVRIKATEKKISIKKKEITNLKNRIRRASFLQKVGLNAKLAAKKSELQQAEVLLKKLKGQRNSTIQSLRKLPQFNIEGLSDKVPFVLLPVRVQIRFITVKHVAKGIQKDWLFDHSKVSTAFSNGISKTVVNSVNKISRTPDKKGMFFPFLSFSAEPSKLNLFPSKVIQKVADKKELWVRILPDDLFVSTHEEALTKDELEAGKNFWTELWKADSAVDSNNQAITDEEKENLKIGAWRVVQQEFGFARAAWIKQQTQPNNFVENSPFVNKPVFPENIPLKESSWTEAPSTFVLPQHFILRTYRKGEVKEFVGRPIPSTIQLGMNPNDPDSKNFEQTASSIHIPKPLKWLTDFNEAEKIGMGIKIPLTKLEAAEGFDKIIVLGVKINTNFKVTEKLMDRFLKDHYFTNNSLSLLSQGTPTNNTDDSPVGKSMDAKDAAQGFKTVFVNQFIANGDHRLKKDGQRLAEALGLKIDLFQKTNGASQSDISEAINMNKVLWQSSLGYYLNQYFRPQIQKNTIEQTRQFMCDYVLGRGPLPVIRIDDQPYGILVSSAFSKWQYKKPKTSDHFQFKLYNKVLKPLDQEWQRLAETLKQLGDPKLKPEEFATCFLEVLGQHASSVSFDQRALFGEITFWNLLAFMKKRNQYFGYRNNLIKKILLNTGLPIDKDNKILKSFFSQEARPLLGPLIDSNPLSESRELEKINGGKKNFIEWLAISNFDTIKKENFTNVGAKKNMAPPQSLLYLLLRHSILREYLESSLNILPGLSDSNLVREDSEFDSLKSGIIWTKEKEQALKFNIEFNKRNEIISQAALRFPGTKNLQQRNVFVNRSLKGIKQYVNQQFSDSKQRIDLQQNKWNYLNKKQQSITGNQTIKKYLDRNWRLKAQYTTDLRNHKKALEALQHLPTARLERLVVEHLDCCHFRLDAWHLALAHERLIKQRTITRFGSHLGAFGYLEEVRPGPENGMYIRTVKPSFVDRKKLLRFKKVDYLIPSFNFKLSRLKPNEIDKLLKISFLNLSNNYKDLFIDHQSQQVVTKIKTQPGNQGFIPTPSMAHAVTAAVLKSGHQAHNASTKNANDLFAVDLSAKRVKTALFLLEGIRSGQELAALLGYQFERSLHDQSDLQRLNLNQYLLDFRKKYPLTKDPEAINTNNKNDGNVVDAMALLEDYRKNTWQSGFNFKTNERTALSKLLNKLEDQLDAVSDLLLSEAVFQMTQGKEERAKAAMKALNEGGPIQHPEIIKIPQNGHVVTHRFFLNFGSGSATAWPSKATARSSIEPRVNQWLKDYLPAPNQICTTVKWMHNEQWEQAEITIDLLKFQPIDLLFVLSPQNGKAGKKELSFRIHQLLLNRQDLNGKINELSELKFVDQDLIGTANALITLFELEPLVEALYQLISNGRPAKPTDFVLSSDPLSDTANKNLLTIDDGTGSQYKQLLDLAGPNKLGKWVTDLKAQKEKILQYEAGQYPAPFLVSIALQIQSLLLKVAQLGIVVDFPQKQYTRIQELKSTVTAVIQTLEKRLKKANESLNKVVLRNPIAAETNATYVQEAAQFLFGRDFQLFPMFTLPNTSVLNAAKNVAQQASFLSTAGDFPIEEWLQSLVPVRKQMAFLNQQQTLGEFFNTNSSTSQTLQIVQLPVQGNGKDKWLGKAYGDSFEPAPNTLSLVGTFPNSFASNRKMSGLVVDDWTEIIPERDLNTGIAMHYDQANSEPPQCIMLAVTPKETGKWDWEDLIGCVEESFELAKKRAVDPELLKRSYLTQLLPSVIAAIDPADNRPSLDFARNLMKVVPGHMGFIHLNND